MINLSALRRRMKSHCMRLEQKLRSSQQILDSFMKYSSDGIVIVDLEGKVVKANLAFEQLHGWSTEELKTLTLPWIPEHRMNQMLEVFHTVTSGEPVKGIETTRMHKNGEMFITSVSVSPVKDQDGRVIAMVSVERDITSLKSVEEQLRIAQQEMKQLLREQQGMTFKFKKVKDKYIHTMADGELLYRMGNVPEEIIGKELSDFFSCNLMVQKKLSFYERAWNGEEHVIYEGTRNGITYLASLRPVKRYGKVVEVIASCVDITERKRTEELLRKSEKLSVVGQLAAGVAHEIRNPLTSLRGFTQLLKAKNEEHGTFFDIMLTELDRINFIVNEFMVVAKPQVIYFEDKDIGLILRSVMMLLDTQAIMHNVQMVYELEAGLPLIRCDENQLKQVFINVLKNAIEAMPNGGEIKLEAGKGDSGAIRIRFIDQGKGIPEEHIPKLGEPFYTTKETGTGLGLMVSYKIIEAHRGVMNITSELNHGTTVEILLPIGIN